MGEISAYLESLGFCRREGMGIADGYILTLIPGNPKTFTPPKLAIGYDYQQLYTHNKYMVLIRTGHEGESLMPGDGINEDTFRGLLATHGDSVRAVVCGRRIVY